MKVIAWRGSSYDYLENTIEAAVAVPDWINTIEIDTRLTSDNKLVAFHSPTLVVYGDKRKISDISWKELKIKKILYKSKVYGINLVSSILESVENKHFILHIKREADVDNYIKQIRKLPYLCSFHSNSEKHLRAIAANGTYYRKLYKSVYLPMRKVLDYVDGYMLGHRITYPTSLTEDWIRTLRNHNKELFAFASMAKSWMEEAVAFDIDGFLTGKFDAASSVLRRYNENRF